MHENEDKRNEMFSLQALTYVHKLLPVVAFVASDMDFAICKS